MKERGPGGEETGGSFRIQDYEKAERPRERLAQLGPEALTSAELLSILLRVGLPGENAVQMGQRLLNKYGGLQGIQRAHYDDLVTERGVGPAKAAQVFAAIELGRRLTIIKEEDTPQIHSPVDAAALVQYEMSALEQEHLRAILLNTRHRVLGIEEVYKGSLNSSQVRIAELFKAAIRKNAAALILAHNHPSGDPSPSPDDVVMTRAVVQAGQLLDIDVLDHLVIGHGRFVSLKERRLGALWND